MASKKFTGKYFPSMYSSPFHTDEDRINRIDFRTFDPYSPENRQTVANCKKHRRQRHNLSDKCKHVIAIIDAQERLLSMEPGSKDFMGYSSQGSNPEQSEISIEFGDGIPEVAKEYIKKWISDSGLLKDPFTREYGVFISDDSTKNTDEPHVMMAVPNTSDIDDSEVDKIVNDFFKEPEKFADGKHLMQVRIFSKEKESDELDAMGFLEHNPRRGVVAVIIGDKVTLNKDVNKAMEYKPKYKSKVIENKKTPPTPEDEKKRREEALNRELESVVDEITDIENRKEKGQGTKRDITRYDNLMHKYKTLKMKAELGENHLERKNQRKQIEDLEYDKTKNDLKRGRQNVAEELLSPEKYIADNPRKEWSDPFGQAMRVVQTPFKAFKHLSNIGRAIEGDKTSSARLKLKDIDRARENIREKYENMDYSTGREEVGGKFEHVPGTGYGENPQSTATITPNQPRTRRTRPGIPQRTTPPSEQPNQEKNIKHSVGTNQQLALPASTSTQNEDTVYPRKTKQKKLDDLNLSNRPLEDYDDVMKKIRVFKKLI